MLLATVETMILDLLSEWTMWSSEKLQDAPGYTAISLSWIELAEYSLNRHFRIYMNELSEIVTCYQNCFRNAMHVCQDMCP